MKVTFFFYIFVSEVIGDGLVVKPLLDLPKFKMLCELHGPVIVEPFPEAISFSGVRNMPAYSACGRNRCLLPLCGGCIFLNMVLVYYNFWEDMPSGVANLGR
jgi:hypothetical protein